jgi:hypothetical protein
MSVKPLSLKRLILLFKAATWGGGGGLKRSRLFVPSPLELRESANKLREVGLVVLAVELGSMPSPKRAFQRTIKEASARVGLQAYTSDNLPFSGAWLVFQEKIAFE